VHAGGLGSLDDGIAVVVVGVVSEVDADVDEVVHGLEIVTTYEAVGNAAALNFGAWL
jgi:hypothetical protein